MQLHNHSPEQRDVLVTKLNEVIQRMLRMEPVQRDILEKIESTLRTEFMTNLARTVVRDEKTGIPKVVWIVRGRKHDHWRHAWGYTVLAAERA